MLLLKILSISGFALAFSEGMQMIWPEGIKPFTCWRCMSLWSGVFCALGYHEPLFLFLPFLFTHLMNRYLWS